MKREKRREGPHKNIVVRESHKEIIECVPEGYSRMAESRYTPIEVRQPWRRSGTKSARRSWIYRHTLAPHKPRVSPRAPLPVRRLG